MSTTSLQKRTSAGALAVTILRAKFGAQLYLPKLANGRLRFNSAGELEASTTPENFIVKTAVYTASSGDRIAADTTAAAFTITLPITPVAGDRVQILDAAGTFDTNNLTIARNGSNINSAASNLVVSAENAIVELIYIDATIGWKAVYSATAAGSSTVSGNATVGGTFGVTGATTLAALSATSGTFSTTLSATGNFAIATNKFTVAAATGNTVVAGTLAVAGSILSSHATSGVGYATGAGGAGVQATNATTAIVLNKASGTLALHATQNVAAGAEQSFTLTNSAIAATDVVVVSNKSGTFAGTPKWHVSATAAGSCVITMTNLHASVAETAADMVLNFAIIKGVAA